MVSIPVRSARIAAARRSRVTAAAVKSDRVEQAVNASLDGTSAVLQRKANPFDQFAQRVETRGAAAIAPAASDTVSDNMIAFAATRLAISLDAGSQHDRGSQKLRFHRLRSFSKVEASPGTRHCRGKVFVDGTLYRVVTTQKNRIIPSIGNSLLDYPVPQMLVVENEISSLRAAITAVARRTGETLRIIATFPKGATLRMTIPTTDSVILRCRVPSPPR